MFVERGEMTFNRRVCMCAVYVSRYTAPVSGNLNLHRTRLTSTEFPYQSYTHRATGIFPILTRNARLWHCKLCRFTRDNSTDYSDRYVWRHKILWRWQGLSPSLPFGRFYSFFQIQSTTSRALVWHRIHLVAGFNSDQKRCQLPNICTRNTVYILRMFILTKSFKLIAGRCRARQH